MLVVVVELIKFLKFSSTILLTLVVSAVCCVFCIVPHTRGSVYARESTLASGRRPTCKNPLPTTLSLVLHLFYGFTLVYMQLVVTNYIYHVGF